MFEDLDPKLLVAVRALARELRYRTLEPVIGRRVFVESVNAIEATVGAAMPELADGAKLLSTREDMAATLAKHGILDLRYEVEAINAPPIGIRALRELGLIDSEVDEMLEEPNALEVLSDWLDECRGQPPIMMVFVEGVRPSDVVRDWRKRGGWRGLLVDEYLPRELTIVDACETNGSFVWLSKHFYM